MRGSTLHSAPRSPPSYLPLLGHIPNLERPNEFNDAVARFLRPIGR